MTEYEKMKAGLIYDPADEEIAKEQIIYLEKLWEFNNLKPSQQKEKEKYMKEVFACCGEGNYIELPFHANWGGHHAHFGSRVYANFNLTLVDDGEIFIGDNVMIGPNVTIATPNHPTDPQMRLKGLQYNKQVHIEKNVWIGSSAVILPGVTIGENSIIGAGSVVTRDIPSDCIAVGNPCKVIKNIAKYNINEHSSIKITKGKNYYFDPFNIPQKTSDADFIFITHPHYDHYSPKDIEMVKNENTIFVFPQSMKGEVENSLFLKNAVFIKPFETIDMPDVKIEAIPAYNIDKPFHPKKNEWVGYKITVQGESFLVCGDTDLTDELKNISCDNLFVPVGGTYTCDYCEAARLVKIINPKKSIPTHFGSVVGNADDGEKFYKLIN